MAIRIKYISHEKQSEIFGSLIATLFRIKRHFWFCKNINYPKKMPVIIALYHAHQLGLYGFEDKDKLNVMISKSKDGDVIAAGTKAMGINPIRGSQSRGGARATLEFLEKLKAGENVAITIDGPRGPRGVVKKGVVEIAKLSGAPIVPYIWHSDSFGFIKVQKSWDKFSYPLSGIKTIGLYGEPIYVPDDINDEQMELYRQKVELELKLLEEKAQKDYKKLLKSKD